MNNASKAHEYFHNVIILDADYAYYADFTVLNPHNMRNPRLKQALRRGDTTTPDYPNKNPDFTSVSNCFSTL